ncbi:hypothetical protein FGO68_gene8748 [Halteria grandinella]|uniref:Uncharacterized protein n=1 Tax=Halteria grandinella TaxID=5974 RepID=A0A8J8NY61_HALGN|nr:hypothetical protein FGO68_gene8748 [Halteria grandinella]
MSILDDMWMVQVPQDLHFLMSSLLQLWLQMSELNLLKDISLLVFEGLHFVYNSVRASSKFVHNFEVTHFISNILGSCIKTSAAC